MLLVAFVSCLHIFHGFILLTFGAQNIASGALLIAIIPNAVVRGLIYITAGTLPWAFRGWRYAIGPQQLLLLLSAASSFVAIISGHYADGTVRPITFIALDQAVYILLALFHVASLLPGQNWWHDMDGNHHIR